MILHYLVYAAVGRVAIYFLQKFPFQRLPWIGRWFGGGGFLYDLISCDLCLGVWVYTLLASMMQINLLEEFGYLPLISELLTGAVTSLLVHLVRVGWQSEFAVVYME